MIALFEDVVVEAAVPAGMKRCTGKHRCGLVKPLSCFPHRRGHRRGTDTYCKTCSHKRVRAWEKRNPQRKARTQRGSLLKYKYGISLSDYDAMFRAQGGACAICKSTDPKSRHGFFCVDHCHKTGINRALLCDLCNKGLGLFGDDPDVMRAGATYIEEWKEKGLDANHSEPQRHQGSDSFLDAREVRSGGQGAGLWPSVLCGEADDHCVSLKR